MTSNRRSPRSRRLRTRSGRPVRWPAARSAIAIASVVFLTLAGTGVAQAVWTAAAVNPTASAESGTVTIGQDGFAALATDYTSVLLTTTKPITLTNGTVPAAYELKLGSVTANAFALAVSVRAWSIVATGTCPATPPPGTVSTPLAEGVTLSGELAAGALARYCVQTSIANTTAGTMASTSLTAQLQLQARKGNWTSPVAVATAAQSVTSTAPRDLAVVKKTHSSISLSWAAAKDKTVTRYEVWRNGERIASAQSATTFNDTGLTAGTLYSYEVQAVDANGIFLAASNKLAVSTNQQSPASGVWYRVVTAAGTCVDAAAPQEKGRVLATKECSTASKLSFVADGQDYKIVVSTATMVWDFKPPKENSTVTLGKDGEGPKAEQRFTLTPLDAATATFQIRSSNEDQAKCLQSAAASATLTMQTCDASEGIRSIQKFSLVEVTAP
jgi:hypothetical protein